MYCLVLVFLSSRLNISCFYLIMFHHHHFSLLGTFVPLKCLYEYIHDPLRRVVGFEVKRFLVLLYVQCIEDVAFYID